MSKHNNSCGNAASQFFMVRCALLAQTPESDGHNMVTYIALGVAALLIGADQLIKYWALANLSQVGSIPIIGDVFHLTYVENRGAAFGMLQGQKWILVGATSLVLLGALVFLLTKRVKSRVLIWAISLIISGGVGNLIDRIARGFVVDYLDFRLINFYVFNLADSCVCVGVGLVLLYLIFLEPRQLKRKALIAKATDDGGLSEQK
jgi:signal peptidase II